MKKSTLMLASLLLAAGSSFAAVPANGVYEILHLGDVATSRGYMVQKLETNTIHPAEARLVEGSHDYTTSEYCFQSRTAEGVNSYWYLYTEASTGNSYIFSVNNGKFIAYGNGTEASTNTRKTLLTMSDEPAPFAISDATQGTNCFQIQAKSNTNTAVSNSIGWGFAEAYRFTSVENDYGGVPHQFISATETGDEEVINAAITKIKEIEPISELKYLRNDFAYTINSRDRGYLYYNSNNSEYISSTSDTSDGETISDDEPTGAEDQQFAIMRTDNTAEGQYYLYSVAANKFLTYSGSGVALGLTEDATFTWDLMENSGFVLVRVPGTSKTYINVTNWSDANGIRVAHCDDPDGGNLMEIVKCSSDADLTSAMEKVVKNDARAALDAAAYPSANIGNELGQYTNAANHDFAALIAAVESALEGTDVSAINAATTALNEALASLTLNIPQAGKFYRIKSKVNGKYISAPANGATGVVMVMSETISANNVFYVDAEGHLLVYGTGYYCNGVNHAMLGNADTYVFEASKNSTNGTFAIKPGTKNYWYDNGEVLDAYGNGTHLNCDWIVEEVEWLPIKIDESFGWTTFYSPVELGLHGRVKAYTGTINSEDNSDVKLVVAEQTAVPANTGVLLQLVKDAETDGGYVYLPVQDTTLENVASDLKGTFAVTTISSIATANVAARSESASTGTANYYVFEKDTDGEGKSFGEFNMNNADNLAAFAAYLELSNVNDETITIQDSEGNNPTGIEEIVADAYAGKTVIYDLQGRKLSAPVKGINIINGKKVLVK